MKIWGMQGSKGAQGALGKGVKNRDKLPRVLESPSLQVSQEHSVLRAGDRTGVGQAGLCSEGVFWPGCFRG